MRKEDIYKEWLVEDPTIGKVRFWYSVRYANTEYMETQIEEETVNE